MLSLSENLELVRTQIRKFSPHPYHVKIEAVTKSQDEKKVWEAIHQGIDILGVNYVQEGSVLRNSLSKQKVEWHFIGHIQSRKTKFLLDYDVIESVDRLEIAEDLNQRAGLRGKPLSLLVQVNIGLEPQKSGVLPENLEVFVAQIRKLPSLNLEGLMAMPPALPLEERRPYFKAMRNWFLKLGFQDTLHTLSLGTSEDYSLALQEGANLIRLGTALFGPRDTSTQS